MADAPAPFFGPDPLGPWGGAKRSNIIQSELQSQFLGVVSLSKNINPSLVLVQPRKTRPFITERLLMGRKESNQTNKTKQSQFQRFLNQTLCIFSQMKDI